MYEDEPLKDYYTLMDIAYIYTWRRVRDLFFGKTDLISNLFTLVYVVVNHKCSYLPIYVKNV